MKTRRTLLITAALIPAAASKVFAHGNKDHLKKMGPVKKEQMPWGIAGEKKQVRRTISVGMADDMRFTPDRIQVTQGETVMLECKNNGQVMHEFVIGTKEALDEHAALMIKFPTMEHEEPYMAHVPPGKNGRIIWTFNKAGEFQCACLIAGHYQAGMIGKITVKAA